MFRLKRAFEPVSSEDGFRVLVERLWPRGLSKRQAAIDLWLKEIAPSSDLRKWFHHDPAKWAEFSARYATELEGRAEPLDMLRRQERRGSVTLVYAAKDEGHNGALVLKRVLTRNRRKA